MISREFRFHGYNALRYVYKQGKTARSPLCLLRYAPNPKRRMLRVAVVVGKKTDKSAVVRNRIRRRIYAVVHELLIADGRVGGRAAFDLVFTIVDARVATMPEKTIKDTIKRLLQITGLDLGPVEK